MSKRIQKSVHGYFSKLKQHAPHVHLPSKSITSSTNWILSGCKYPKTPSFAIDKKANEVPCPGEGHAATLSDVDRFLLENFSSLFCDEKKMNNNNNNDDDDDDDDEDDKKKKIDGKHYDDDENTNGFLFESPRLIGPMPEIRTSQRFFVSHSTSSSLVEEAQSIASTSEEVQSTTTTTTSSTTRNFMESVRTSTEIKGVPLPDESIAVLTYSPDPYNDFRQSMEEMIEARLNQNQSIDWDFMEELLFCYLKLNEKKSYRYILSAFVDLTASLKQNNDKTPAREGHIPTKSARRNKRNGLV